MSEMHRIVADIDQYKWSTEYYVACGFINHFAVSFLLVGKKVLSMEKEEQNQISFNPFGDTLTSYDSTIIMDLGNTFDVERIF